MRLLIGVALISQSTVFRLENEMKNYLKVLLVSGAAFAATASQAALDPAIATSIDASQADGLALIAKVTIFMVVLWGASMARRKAIG